MGNTSLLVHRINNNIENIEVLLEEDNLDKEIINIVGEIINEQMNNILENAELYYLEDEEYAFNKEKLLFLEYVNYIKNELLKTNEITTKMIYKNQKVSVNIEIMMKMLKYLLSKDFKNIEKIEVDLMENQLHIKINLEKNKEHSLQNK